MSDLIASYVELVLPYITYLIPMPVLIPVAGAALTLLLSRFRRAQSQIAFIMLALSSLVSLTLLAVADVDGIQTLQIGGWDAPVGITLVADRLSTVMLFTSSIVLFSVMWYAISQGVRDGGEDEPVTVFLPTYMLLTMGVNVSFLAGDLFNLYVGFEIFLVASYVLLTLGASPARVRAGVGYVMVSMVSSMIFLLGIGLTYAAVGTVNMAQIGIRIADIPEGTRTAIFGVLLVAFGIKAAVVPLDAWLPDSYPTAPALVTAVFAGLLTKVGVYSIIRMRSAVFTDGSLDTLLMWVALATMIVGILGAWRRPTSNVCCPLLWSAILVHDLWCRTGHRAGPVRCDLLCRTPHSGANSPVPGGRPYRKAIRHLIAAAPRFLAVHSTSYFDSVLHPCHQPRRNPAVLWLHGQDFASTSRRKRRLLVGVGSYRRRRCDIAFDLVRHGVGLVQGLPPRPRRRPRGPRALARPAPLADITDEVEYSERADVGRLPFGMFASTALLVTASTVITFVAGPVSGITSRSAESAQDQTIYQDAVLGEHYDNPTRHLDPQDRYVDGDSIENRDHLLPEPEPAANGSNTNSDTGTDNATESGEDEQ